MVHPHSFFTPMVRLMRHMAQDCISAESNLADTYFEDMHTYGMYIEPGEYISWYIDDVLLFNVSKDAMTSKTNYANTNQTVGQRQIPVEPMYIILNVASSEAGFQPRDASYTYPQTMSIDYVRLYQNTNTHSTGCDPTDYPTATYINANTVRPALLSKLIPCSLLFSVRGTPLEPRDLWVLSLASASPRQR